MNLKRITFRPNGIQGPWLAAQCKFLNMAPPAFIKHLISAAMAASPDVPVWSDDLPDARTIKAMSPDAVTSMLRRVRMRRLDPEHPQPLSRLTDAMERYEMATMVIDVTSMLPTLAESDPSASLARAALMAIRVLEDPSTGFDRLCQYTANLLETIQEVSAQKSTSTVTLPVIDCSKCDVSTVVGGDTLKMVQALTAIGWDLSSEYLCPSCNPDHDTTAPLDIDAISAASKDTP